MSYKVCLGWKEIKVFAQKFEMMNLKMLVSNTKAVMTLLFVFVLYGESQHLPFERYKENVKGLTKSFFSKGVLFSSYLDFGTINR